MKPSRLFSAGWQAMTEGVGHWTTPAWAILGPGRLAPRWLWVGSVDCADRQEPPGKKLLSEKKLVRLVTGKELGCSFPLGRHGRCFEFSLSCLHLSSLRYWRDTPMR